LVASALFFQNIPATLEPPWSSPAPARDYTGLLTAFFYIMNPTHLGRPQCHTGPYGTPRPTLPPHPLDPPYPPPPPHEGNKYLVVSRCVVPACPARFTLGFFSASFGPSFNYVNCMTYLGILYTGQTRESDWKPPNSMKVRHSRPDGGVECIQQGCLPAGAAVCLGRKNEKK
jgi:hypothetical protein